MIPSSRRGALWRFFFAAVIIIGASAGTTAVAGLLQFKQLAQDLQAGLSISRAPIQIANPGDPQTLLIVGSDHRAGAPVNGANTDTMLLVRLDGSSKTINVMSIPRDLQVQIPGFGTGKLNSAYSDGGTKLLVKTIQHQVFPGLHVNHIIDVNFGGFIALVNAIGCVYTDVDHRYYNDTRLTGYSSINIQPGYQRLCGFHALQFVRFRHSDSDLVRNARQQDFIRWAKDQYGVNNLVSNRDTLLRTFGKYTQTDGNLRTVDGLDNLFQLVAFSAGHTINQIKFPAILPLSCTVQSCYVTANAGPEAAAFRAFMRPTVGAPKPPAANVKARKRSDRVATAGLTPDVSDGQSQATALSHDGMAVYYPRLILNGSVYCSSLAANCPLEIPSPGSYPRAYEIKDQQGKLRHAYRMTLVLNPAFGQYYGVQGTTWQHPPILGTPAGIRFVGGKRLELFTNGGKLTDVAWRTPQGVYWISNTLTSDISNQQMVEIAASLRKAGP